MKESVIARKSLSTETFQFFASPVRMRAIHWQSTWNRNCPGVNGLTSHAHAEQGSDAMRSIRSCHVLDVRARLVFGGNKRDASICGAGGSGGNRQ